MAFESEVIPLFIGGVIVVSIIELLIGCLLLRERKETRALLIGHVVSMLAAMFFLVRCIFAGRLGIDTISAYGDSSPFNSVNIGLFGVCWAISVCFVLAIIGSSKNGK